MFDVLLIDRPDFSLSEAVPVSDQSAHEPDVCLDESGSLWVTWSKRGIDGDVVLLKRFEQDTSVIVLSSERGVECQPGISLLSPGVFLTAWVAQRDGVWHILSRTVSEEGLGEECIVGTSREGVFRPRLVAKDGSAWLAFEQVERGVNQIKVVNLVQGKWSAPQSIQDGSGDCFRPSLTVGPDGDILLAYDQYEGSSYDVKYIWLNQLDNPYRLTDGIDRDVQSAAMVDGSDSAWLAWSTTHGNRDADPWWLTKYVTIRRLERGRVFEPVESMPGRDLHREEAFQGWEFPELAMDAYGRVWVFGQASHRLYAQYLHAGKWSERFTVSQERWGSWKPRVRTVGSEVIFIASMGLEGAQIQRLKALPPSDRPASDWRDRLLKPLSVSAETPPRPLRPIRGENRPIVDSELKIYFGDLHAHSVYGDGVGDMDEFYYRYRDGYGYDFAALTEHDFLDGIQLSRSELEMMWATADRMTEDGRFVAFYGYEWTSPALADHTCAGGSVGEGHRHVLYPDKSGPLISYGGTSANTGNELLARLRGRRALVIPHHTAWSGTNLDAYDPELSRLIEICSTHGRFEYPGNRPIGYRRDHVHAGKYVVDALARGHRLGFVGGSDSHGLLWHAIEMEGRAKHIGAGTRVGWKEDAYRTGMTAILAQDLTRSALFDALYERRCYATSGVPIALDFRINGSLMGTEIDVASTPQLTVAVNGTAPIEAVEIIRQGYVFEAKRFPRGERPIETEIEIADDLLIPGETQYYYARITQEDGNMAWSSPIWVTYE